MEKQQKLKGELLKVDLEPGKEELVIPFTPLVDSEDSDLDFKAEIVDEQQSAGDKPINTKNLRHRFFSQQVNKVNDKEEQLDEDKSVLQRRE